GYHSCEKRVLRPVRKRDCRSVTGRTEEKKSKKARFLPFDRDDERFQRASRACLPSMRPTPDPDQTRLEQLTQIAPVVELVGIFNPPVANVRAVIHVGNQDVANARIDLRLCLLHGGAGAYYDENDTGRAGNKPLSIHFLYVFYVHALNAGLFENDSGIFGKRFESTVVVKRERRNGDTHADLEAAARAPLRFLPAGQLPKQIADWRQHTFLLNADGRIAEARSELQRIDAVVVYDAVEVDVADVAFFSKLRFHLQEGLREQAIGLAPEHGGAHFSCGRSDVAGKQ